MECFVHEGVAAVGVCKGCGKALCRSCATDLGFALVCGDTCASDVSHDREVAVRARRVFGITGSKPKVPTGPLIGALFAVMFAGYGAVEWWRTGQPQWFSIIMGVTVAVAASFAYVRARSLGLPQ